jgi:hypothetical protein
VTPFSFVRWVVSPSSFYGLWWALSKDRQPNGQKRKGSSDVIKRRTDNPINKRDRCHQRP